jgi:hypothetical protein
MPNLPIGLQGGGTIAIQGGGKLTISRRGKPRTVNGGGLYAIFGPSADPTMNGPIIESGTWKAKELILFDSYGGGIGPPPEFNAGRALIRVQLKPDFGRRSDAVLEVGCRLGAANPGIPGTIEGVRVMVDGGLYYNLPADPKSTLFVDLN